MLADIAFAGGSIVAAFAQGIILGGLIQGITVVDGRYAGGPFDWATPFALLCGVALVAGYALIGATWLIAKTDGSVAAFGRRQARILLIVVLAFVALVSLWTPYNFARISERWFSTPNIYFLWPVPILTALLGWAVWRSVGEGEYRPFLGVIGLFILSYLGLGISFYPYILPPSLTIWDAAAPAKSLEFLLVGAVVLIPLILAYTAWSYWIFRGKVGASAGYH